MILFKEVLDQSRERESVFEVDGGIYSEGAGT